jgi:hypothetical protein
MATRSFSTGVEPRVHVTHLSGDLTVEAWDEARIELRADVEPREAYQEGDALIIDGCEGDLTLCLPYGSKLVAGHVSGDCRIADLRSLELHQVRGDLTINRISGPVDIETVGGDVTLRQAGRLRFAGRGGGDLGVSAVAEIEVEHIAGDMELRESDHARIGRVDGDVTARNIGKRLEIGAVGGDCRVEDALEAAVAIGTVGSDLRVNTAAGLQLGTVESDAAIQAVAGNLEFGSISDDLSLADVGGNIKGGSVGDDAVLRGMGGSIEIGSIGGDLSLEARFPADSVSRLNVAGDTALHLPAQPSLRLRATVRGDASGPASLSNGGRLELDYGAGAALLELQVGGDLAVRGGGSPHSSSSSSGSAADFADFDRSMRDFGREMGELGRELGRLGQELGRELAAAFAEGGWSRGAGIADEVAENVDRRKRRAEAEAAKQARRAERLRVKINEREWQLDPERLERIKEQARRAAAEGLAGALETVERAIGRMRAGVPPAPDTASASAATASAATGATIRIDIEDQPAGAEPQPADADRRRERETILRLVAEGRISPEEGDMLLEALE